jgi:predicted nucleic acid-binding Zn ribbon protein
VRSAGECHTRQVDRDDELDELQVALTAAPPSELASLLDRVVRGMGAPGTDAIELVFNRWSDVVGGVLATKTRPVSLERATLVLQADDPAVVSHVKWLEQDLLTRLDELLGPGRVTGVEVRVARPGRPSRRP